MGCNCGGGRKPSPGGPLYVLTLPTGRKKTYSSQADAERAQKRLGGQVNVKS